MTAFRPSSMPSMDSETIRRAARIWDYLSRENEKNGSDAIVVCCSYDLRVCDHACDMIEAGLAERLVLSGKTGNWTRHLWQRPEAVVFRDHALQRGIDSEHILLETESTNFGENIEFSKRLIPEAKVVTFVAKPNALLRVRLTAALRWPEVRARVSCPEIAFPQEVSPVVGLWGLLHEMVGDIERVRRYPALGYQVAHSLPREILDD